MRISFTLTKEYEIWIDKEDVDKYYCGDVNLAIQDKLKEAEEVEAYVDDIEVLDTFLSAEDEDYEERLDEEYWRERDLQESLYYRDLI